MMTKKAAAAESMNVADAKRRFSELLGRVAFGGATILITRRGRPMARLVPPSTGPASSALAGVAGWLDDRDPFFASLDDTMARRSRPPRVLSRRNRTGS